jgi:hypothetical protein
MAEPHVTNGADKSESVTTVTPPKRDRAEYMRRYRARHKPDRELDNQIDHEPKLESAISEPPIKSDAELNPEPIIPPEPKTEVDKYQAEVTRADEAAEALKAQLAELHRSEEINRRQQQQANEINQQANQVFHFWQQNGASPEQQQIFRANPAFMIQLTEFAHNEASKLHEVNSEQYLTAGKRVFFETLDRLAQQAKQNSAVPQPETDMPPNESPPAFLTPTPAPMPRRQPQAPTRSGIVSAPVTREAGLLSDSFDRKGQTTLSAQEVEAARISGITPAEYAKQRQRYQQMKREGLVE